MEYYDLHREERLAYQKQYNKSEYYKAYQQEYFQKNKEKIYKNKKPRVKKQKPLAQYKIDKLEAMIRRKLKQYNIENVKPVMPPPVISTPIIKNDTIKNEFPPGYEIRNGFFVVTF